MSDFDLIVIGGGVNGAGIARDAAMRGLNTCLLEQGDACQATTRWSSRLIHGGLRYLEHAEFGLVYESLHEREALLRIAPHLVKPLRLIIPLYRGARRGRFIVGCGMWLYDLLSWRKSLPRHAMLDRDETVKLLPGLNDRLLDGAAAYFDGQVPFAERLVVENLLSARQHGADVRTYSRVSAILKGAGRVRGVRYTDLRNDTEVELGATVVVNATGPWVDRLLQRLPRPPRRFMGGTKGTHIVVPAIEGIDSHGLYLEAESDGRPFFILPWCGMTLIGTTDLRYDGDPGDVGADSAEVDYLLDETNRAFPNAGMTRASVYYRYTGLRPLPRAEGKRAGAITRRHVIKHHHIRAPGLYSAIGGKLTTFRHLAEEVVDRAMRHIHGAPGNCRTALEPLPGAVADTTALHERLIAVSRLDDATVERLISVYGARAEQVVELVARRPDLGRALCSGAHAIAAEIVFAFEDEFATTLADALLRRTMVGLSSDLGRAALDEALAVAREALGWSVERAEAERAAYLREIEALEGCP